MFDKLKRFSGNFIRTSSGKSREPDVAGRIFNIQKFSINDGPGIRTTVFFKGCPLHCAWCSNPESINPNPELITNFQVCVHCNQCVEACTQNAIIVENSENSRPVRSINREKCNACMDCVKNCTSGALRSTGSTVSAKAVLEKVEQDVPFYNNSGGGITLSGGEPLLQPEFALAILKLSKRKKIHTVLDTSGYAQKEVFKTVLPFLDLVMFDVKHMDPGIHKKYTGVDNRIIQENLGYLNGKVNIWLRVPLIPGFNDDQETIIKILDLAGDLCIEKLFFLPYHQWGIGKYSGLGRTYTLSGLESIPDEKIEVIRHLCKSRKIRNYDIEQG